MSIGLNNNSDEVYTYSQLTSNEGTKKTMEAQLRVLAARSMNANAQFQNFLETAIDTVAGGSVYSGAVSSSGTGSINVPEELEGYFDEASTKYNVDKRLVRSPHRIQLHALRHQPARSNGSDAAHACHGAGAWRKEWL